MTKEIINEAIQYWIHEGEAPDGFEIRPIAWIHADKITEADDEEQFRVILGRLLQAGATFNFEIRSAERVL